MYLNESDHHESVGTGGSEKFFYTQGLRSDVLPVVTSPLRRLMLIFC